MLAIARFLVLGLAIISLPARAIGVSAYTDIGLSAIGCSQLLDVPDDEPPAPLTVASIPLTSCGEAGIGSAAASAYAEVGPTGLPAFGVYAATVAEGYAAGLSLPWAFAGASYQNQLLIPAATWWLEFEFELSGTIERLGAGGQEFMEAGAVRLQVQVGSLFGPQLDARYTLGTVSEILRTPRIAVLPGSTVDIYMGLWADSAVNGGNFGGGDIRSGSQTVDFLSTLVLRDVVLLDAEENRIFAPLGSELGPVYALIPVPPAAWLFLSACGLLAAARRHRGPRHTGRASSG